MCETLEAQRKVGGDGREERGTRACCSKLVQCERLGVVESMMRAGRASENDALQQCGVHSGFFILVGCSGRAELPPWLVRVLHTVGSKHCGRQGISEGGVLGGLAALRKLVHGTVSDLLLSLFPRLNGLLDQPLDSDGGYSVRGHVCGDGG